MLEPDDPQVDQVSFDEILQSSPSLPSPGPELYDARRRLWLTPRIKPATEPPSSSRQKLEFLLNQPDAIHNQDLWRHSLEKIWDGLSSGGRLKYRLPMNLIVKIVHAAWLRDRTWPVGMEAPDSDETLNDERSHHNLLALPNRISPTAVTHSSEANNTTVL
ncbi:hypothetical protein BYT27DRAFT_7182686 [Phlegmacium glaucopus]|nr:hypothetical protein BYT27DRAFT_7182686 [Phlegmacium glaucopus]